MRIIASMVTKNETGRFLQSMIEHNSVWWDDLFVYDDQSTDGTVDFLKSLDRKPCLVVRKDGDPSFLEHEGIFRSNALMALEQYLNPQEDDWIFAIDSDEFLNTRYDPVVAALRLVIKIAEKNGNTSVNLNIPEVWDVNGTHLSKRTDGFWDTMSLPRLYKYNPDWAFRNKAMGSGSGPACTYSNMFDAPSEIVELTHMGYAYPEDRQAKYDRYTSLPNHGHNHNHILSIIGKPTLAPYDLRAKFWRGVV